MEIELEVALEYDSIRQYALQRLYVFNAQRAIRTCNKAELMTDVHKMRNQLTETAC